MAKSLKLRSWLIVAPTAGTAAVHSADADRVVLDLTGTPDAWSAAPEFCKAWTGTAPGRPPAFLLPPRSSGRMEDAAQLAVRSGAPTVLARVSGGADIQRLDVILRVEEVRAGLVPGGTGIVPLADEAGILAAASLPRSSARLVGLGWDIGCDPLSDTALLARATVGLAASVAGIAALDTVSPAGDEASFRAECLTARGNGFAGKLCRRMDQVAIINQIFDQPPAPGGRVISNTSEPPSA